jgi:hypothetical protein
MARVKAGRSVAVPIDIIGEFTEYAKQPRALPKPKKTRQTRKPRRHNRTVIGPIDIIGEFIEDASQQRNVAQPKKAGPTRRKKSKPKD